MFIVSNENDRVVDMQGRTAGYLEGPNHDKFVNMIWEDATPPKIVDHPYIYGLSEIELDFVNQAIERNCHATSEIANA